MVFRIENKHFTKTAVGFKRTDLSLRKWTYRSVIFFRVPRSL